MRRAVPDWEVSPQSYEPLMEGLRLPDKDDLHVLAATIAGHADCFVTINLKDFLADALHAHGLEASHPDDFLVYQLDLEHIAVLGAFKAMRERLRNPVMSVDEFIASLQRNGLVNTASRLLEARASLTSAGAKLGLSGAEGVACTQQSRYSRLVAFAASAKRPAGVRARGPELHLQPAGWRSTPTGHDVPRA